MSDERVCGDQYRVPCPWCGREDGLIDLWDGMPNPGDVLECDHCGEPIEIESIDLIADIRAKRGSRGGGETR